MMLWRREREPPEAEQVDEMLSSRIGHPRPAGMTWDKNQGRIMLSLAFGNEW